MLSRIVVWILWIVAASVIAIALWPHDRFAFVMYAIGAVTGWMMRVVATLGEKAA